MPLSSLWRSSAATDCGKVRARNEDAFLDKPEARLWVVADGMGGHHGGDIASRLVIDSIAQLPAVHDLEQRTEQLRQCLHWLNRRLSQEMTITRENAGKIIGSTVVALLAEGSRAVCIWAGDSRCYLKRGERLYQLSHDHSVLEQLQREEHLSLEEASKHPQAHALTQALGGNPQLTLDILELDVQPGDRFLLCSDGLYQELSTDVLSAALDHWSPERALKQLFDRVLAGTADDNLTGVVISL